jgi:phosphopantothenoylcysteine decarboxylase/phosphopantothenate--cysteine ligase
LIRIETAQEMRAAVNKHFQQADIVIMAAAVGDYRSLKYYPDKLKKRGEKIILELVKNPDILFELGQRKRKNQILVGFAAETENIFVNAQKKLRKKNLDLLVLNEIAENNPAFGCDENQVYLVLPDTIKKLEKMAKAQIAARVWDEIVNMAGKTCSTAEFAHE